MAVTWVLSIHPGVWDDADDAIDYYAGVEDGLPQRFIAELEDTFVFVRQFPLAGRLLHTKYRRVSLRRFPYLVCYRVFGDVVRVLAIVHNRRDPKWVRRRLANRI
jgi:toxin ParE1/3/4